MKFANLSMLLFLLFILMFSNSCRKPAASSNIKINAFAGNVQLINQNDAIASNHAGTTVTIENVLPVISTTTDANG
jgi:hypothetical protein